MRERWIHSKLSRVIATILLLVHVLYFVVFKIVFAFISTIVLFYCSALYYIVMYCIFLSVL